VDSETEKKIKEWNDIEISDEGKYPSWFLECDKNECVSLRKKLNLKDKGKNKN